MRSALLALGILTTGCGTTVEPPHLIDDEPTLCQPAFYFDDEGNLINLCPGQPIEIAVATA
jgi:hypothetical protein